MNFIPQLNANHHYTPFFDDQKTAKSAVSGWRAERTHQQYIASISSALVKLDALGIVATPGEYPGNPPRFGFRFTFSVYGVSARIDCAALPIRKFTELRKKAALAQSLYLLQRELESAADAWIYKPGSMPLIPYLIGASDQTVTESLLKSGVLPDVRPVGFLQSGETIR